MAGLTVMAIKRTWEFPVDEDLGGLLDRIAKHRRFEVDQIEERGSVILTTVEPVPVGWKVVRSVLAVVREEDVIEKDRFGQMQLRTMNRTTKGQLATLVAWAVKYPAGLLYGDDDRTVDLMRASWNKQMFTTSGLMRNKQFRECLHGL
jgi:hypothetical protein